MAADAARPAGRRARDPRRHRPRPQRLRRRRDQPGRLRRRAAAAVQRRRRCAAAELPRRAAHLHARPGARRRDDRRRSAARRRSRRRDRAARVRAVRRLARRRSRPSSPTRRGCASAGAFPVACGEKVWPIAYADPKSYNERALAGLWREQGGKLTGGVRDGAAPATTPSFELRSPTLAEVVRDINKLSNNVMAQQLFLTLGATQRGAGTPEAARDVVRQWLRGRVGGAGRRGGHRQRLGPVARLAPQRRAARPPAAGGLVEPGDARADELAAGRRRRRHDAALASGAPGRAHLKTGSLRDVVGVAGCVLADSGRRYVRRRHRQPPERERGAARARSAGRMGGERRARRSRRPAPIGSPEAGVRTGCSARA